MADTATAMVATDADMVAMGATGVAAMDTARGLLMLSLRLMPLLRLVTAAAMVMVVMAAAMVAMAAMDTAVDTARGRLRLSPATAMAATDADMAAMVATGMADTATARGRLRLSPATAMVVMA